MTFTAHEHPRTGDGRFTTKPVATVPARTAAALRDAAAPSTSMRVRAAALHPGDIIRGRTVVAVARGTDPRDRHLPRRRVKARVDLADGDGAVRSVWWHQDTEVLVERPAPTVEPTA